MNLKNVMIPGHRYTLVQFDNKTGFLDCNKFILSSLHKKCICDNIYKYTIVRTGNKNELKWLKFIFLSSTEEFILWAGFCKPDIEVVVHRSMHQDERGPVRIEKRWMNFDSRYLIKAKNSVKYPPLAELIKPVKPEQLITYQCVSE